MTVFLFSTFHLASEPLYSPELVLTAILPDPGGNPVPWHSGAQQYLPWGPLHSQVLSPPDSPALTGCRVFNHLHCSAHCSAFAFGSAPGLRPGSLLCTSYSCPLPTQPQEVLHHPITLNITYKLMALKPCSHENFLFIQQKYPESAQILTGLKSLRNKGIFMKRRAGYNTSIQCDLN